VEAAWRLESAIQLAEVAEKAHRDAEQVQNAADAALRDADATAERIRTVHIRVVKPIMDAQRAADASANVFGSPLRPLMQNLNLTLAASFKPIADSWRPMFARMLAAQSEPLVESINLGIAASLQPFFEQLRATSVGYFRMDLAPFAAAAKALAAHPRLP
jgi:hypothetical protein